MVLRGEKNLRFASMKNLRHLKTGTWRKEVELLGSRENKVFRVKKKERKFIISAIMMPTLRSSAADGRPFYWKERTSSRTWHFVRKASWWIFKWSGQGGWAAINVFIELKRSGTSLKSLRANLLKTEPKSVFRIIGFIRTASAFSANLQFSPLRFSLNLVLHH